MIKSNELRIGNLFNDVDNTPCYFAGAWQRQDGWIIRDSANNVYKENEAYPTPLTAEMLQKCWFVLQAQRQSIYIKGRLKLWLGHTGVIAYLKHEDKDESIFIPNNLSSLHQLQNLYFALTGEELKINL